MNVASSTSASTTSSAVTTSSSSVSSAKSQERSAKTSFADEIKNVEQQDAEQDVQQNQSAEDAKENPTQNNTGDNGKKDNSSENKSAEAEISPENVKLNTADLLSLNIQELLDTQNQISFKNDLFKVSVSTTENLSSQIGETIDYQSLEMSLEDAQFFVDVVNNNGSALQNVVQDVHNSMLYGTEDVQKSANVSKSLLNALQNSAKTGQAVRIDFGNDVSVVMRIGRDGAIMANFIPGDKAVEEYLKHNISSLRMRFEEEEIPYSQLSYSSHQQQEKRHQQENDKENRHE